MNSVMLIQVPAEPDRFLTDGQLNWTISIGMMGALLGGLLAVPAAPLLGARRLLLLAMPVHVLGALAAALGGSFFWVFLGRLLMVAVIGATEGPARTYVAEVMPPHRRALAATAMNVAISAGQVAVLAAAPWLRWQTLMLVAGCASPVLCLCGLLLMPDSAGWLLAQGRPREAARRVVLFYRPHADAETEVDAIRESLTAGRSGESTWRQLRRPETLRPLLMGAVPMVLLCWCGCSTLVLIAPLILDPLSLPLDRYQRVLVVPVLGLLLTTPALPLVDRFGRLPLLRVGGTMSAAGCATIATYFFLDSELQEQLGWLAFVGVVLMAIAHFCIIAPVVFTLSSELLPSGFRAQGAIIIISCLNVSTFFLLKMYPELQNSIGLGGTFIVHMTASLGEVLLATVCLVETKGLTLEQIQGLFSKSSAKEPKSDTEADNKMENEAKNVDIELT